MFDCFDFSTNNEALLFGEMLKIFALVKSIKKIFFKLVDCEITVYALF